MVECLNTFSDQVNGAGFGLTKLVLYNGRALSDETKQSVTDSLTECISAEYLEQLTSYCGGDTLTCTNTALQSLKLSEDAQCQLSHIVELNAGYNRVKQVTIPQI